MNLNCLIPGSFCAAVLTLALLPPASASISVDSVVRSLAVDTQLGASDPPRQTTDIYVSGSIHPSLTSTAADAGSTLSVFAEQTSDIAINGDLGFSISSYAHTVFDGHVLAGGAYTEQTSTGSISFTLDAPAPASIHGDGSVVAGSAYTILYLDGSPLFTVQSGGSQTLSGILPAGSYELTFGTTTGGNSGPQTVHFEGTENTTFTVGVIPEPSPFLLALSAAAMAATLRRRRRRSSALPSPIRSSRLLCTPASFASHHLVI